MASTVTLTIADGPLQGTNHSFSTRTICWVGRQDTCTIQFPDTPEYEAISRLHCLIDIDPPQISIRDFNSTQGTYVDMALIGRRASSEQAPTGIDTNIKVVEKQLYSGSVITLGNISIKVTITGDQPNYAPPTPPQRPTAIRLVADQAIKFIKKVWEVPDSNTGSGSQAGGAQSAIGGYKILKQIGKGGYGEVFLAENDRGEKLALKIMLTDVAITPAKVRMFEREIDNAKALNHPNIVRLLDNGFDPQSNCLFYAMEYCEGNNLDAFIEKMGGILPLELAKPIIFQILNGLEYTHNAEIPFVRLADGSFGKGYGLVHRDLKPSNIMLAQSNLGQVAKIGDFGLSKAFDFAGLSGHTMIGDGFIGTPHFMCRRQVLQFQEAKPEVDVWAAAACLYQMLTNQYPRDIKSDEGWEVLLQKPAIPILDRNPALPKPLATVIDRALAEDAQNQEALHYQRVIDFKNDLTQAFAS
jgi:eukaryotic-like serine/threonine-protein kinase